MKFNNQVYTFSKKQFGDIANKISYNPDFSSLVTFSPNRKLSRHRWFYYKESFSSDLVKYLLTKLKTNPNEDYILDPFCGVGTTPLTSKMLGYNHIGIDILPLCTFITKTKLANYNPKKIEEILLGINGKPKSKPEKFGSYYIDKSFDSKVLSKILNLKQEISEISNKEAKNLARLALLSILLPASKAVRDGGFLRFNKEKIPENVTSLFNKKILMIIEDIKNSKFTKKTDSIILNDDARTCNIDKKFSAVITSPPYLNRYDYTRLYALELTFDFVDDKKLKELRYQTIKSHIESKSDHKIAPSELLASNLDELSKAQLTNSQIPNMVLGYYADLYATLKNISKYAKKNAKMAFILSSSRFSGIHFEADLILTQLGENLGLKLDEIIVTKLRGSSAQQARKYGDVPLRESIVIFKT